MRSPFHSLPAPLSTQANFVTRTTDGTDTHFQHGDWGASGQTLIRLTGATYADGLGEMVTDRPNARVISNTLAHQNGEIENSLGASDLLWAWGQFIDHDLDLSEEGNTEFASIAVPDDDPVFAEGGEVLFSRVTPNDDTGEDSPREYHNQITALLDASMVYGSDAETAASLRDGAKLRLEDSYLVRTEDGVLAGDVRAAENVALTSLHTLLARAHNAEVDALAEEHPNWGEARMFAQARARTEAKIQAITYNEFLPILVGEDAIAAYQGYDPDVNPGISLEFSAAAYRFGHSLLSPNLLRLEENGESIEAGPLTLQEAFFNPDVMTSEGGIAPILRGLAASTAQDLDTQVVEDVRSFLFAPTGEIGLDLAAINIQRGRDLGVSSYNDLREALGLERAETFFDITSDLALAADLDTVYGDVDMVDAWVGGLAEDSFGDGMLGETFATVIIDQFTRVRDGDPLWSEAGVLWPAVTAKLWDTTLADLIEDHSAVRVVQDNAFWAYNRMVGHAWSDEMMGSTDRDLLLGRRRADDLNGGAGDDQVEGGRGNDTLAGGTGNDMIYGGAGSDTFVLDADGSHDTVADWETRDFVMLTEGTEIQSIKRVGDDMVITLNADTTVTLRDVKRSDMEDMIILDFA